MHFRLLLRAAAFARRIALWVPCMLTAVVSGPVFAQDVLPPNRGGFTVSMGVPPTWTWAAGFSAGVHGGDDRATAYVNTGVYRDLLNPMTAGLGILTEAYFGTRGTFAGTGNFDEIGRAHV